MKFKEENLIFVYKNYGVKCPNRYYTVDDNTIAIQAKTIRGDVQYGMIDKDDFEKVKVCNWKLVKDSLTYYLHNSRYGFLHRLIMNTQNEMQIDHIDGNGLNNRKSNLRIVTSSENSKNHHNVTGIYFDDLRGYPRFRVKWNDENGKRMSKTFSLSQYGTLDEAYEKAKEYRIWVETNIYKNHRYFEKSGVIKK